MIIKLTDTCQHAHGHRSFLDTRTGDIILQGVDTDWQGLTIWEVIVRGNNTSLVDARHINHKREVVKRLKSSSDPTLYDAESLSEDTLDGIIRDYASAHQREGETKKENQHGSHRI